MSSSPDHIEQAGRPLAAHLRAAVAALVTLAAAPLALHIHETWDNPRQLLLWPVLIIGIAATDPLAKRWPGLSLLFKIWAGALVVLGLTFVFTPGR